MKISVILEALTGTFETDINRARKESEKAFKQMKRDAELAGKVIGGALVAAAGAATLAIKGAINEMDRISKGAQKIGVTTEALSALEYAAGLADVSTQSLQQSMTKLSKQQADAVRGMEEQVALFTALGVEVQNADGTLRASDQVFADIADRFASMADGADKTAIAVKLFGRSGADLIPLLNGGAAGLREARKEAEHFGKIISTSAGRSAEQFNDNMGRLQFAVQGAANAATTALLPVLEDLSNQVVGMVKDPAFSRDLANSIRTIGETSIAAVRYVADLTNGLGFLWDEFQQLRGIVANDDLVRLAEDLETARASYARMQAVFANTGSRVGSGEWQGLVQAHKQVAELTARLEAAEERVRRRLRGDELQEIDLRDLPQRRSQGDDVAARMARAEEARRQAAKAASDAAAAAKREVEQLDQSFRSLHDSLLEEIALYGKTGSAVRLRYQIEHGELGQLDATRQAALLAAAEEVDRLNAGADVLELRRSLLSEEERAVSDLQAAYIRLQNAVAAKALTPEDATGIAAGLAQQWADAQAERNAAELDALRAGLQTQEEEIEQSYQRRRDMILEYAERTGTDQTALLVRLEQQRAEQLLEVNGSFWQRWLAAAEENLLSLDDLTADLISNISQGFGSALESIVFDFTSVQDAAQQLAESLARSVINAIGQMAAQWLIYKAVQAASQGTAATAAATGLALQAQAHSQMAGIAAYASTAAIPIVGPAAAPAAAAAAIAATQPMAAAIAATAASAAASQFAGAFDRGGQIPSGMFGLVGERGPELVAGPATVTGRMQTASMLREASGTRDVKLRQIIVMGEDQIAGALGSDPAEKAFITHASRNAGRLRQIIGTR